MIQVIGSSELHFKNKELSLSIIEGYLKDELVKFDILSQITTNQESKVTIKFIMNMNEIEHCKTIEDYNSHIFYEFSKILPNKLYALHIIVYKITPISNEPIKHIKDHMTKHSGTIFFD